MNELGEASASLAVYAQEMEAESSLVPRALEVPEVTLEREPQCAWSATPVVQPSAAALGPDRESVQPSSNTPLVEAA